MRRRANGRAIDTPSPGPRYSTQDLLDLERRLVDRAMADTDHPLGVADESSVVAALTARPTLSEEQLEMVATLTTSGRAVDVVILAAGTGKTFSLDAARDAWQRSGHLVLGTALAARAAAELETTAGIPSHTVASLLADLDHGARGPFPINTILVVDEAGMVGTRQLARVLDHAEVAHTKVVLVGDPHQIPEIDAGGLVRGLGARLPTIRLTDIRRQRESWERDALAHLRDGHVRHAYATTIHKAQGQTVDRAFVLGSDTLYQEAGYVALSRGRAENRIYLVGSEPRPEAHAQEATPPGASRVHAPRFRAKNCPSSCPPTAQNRSLRAECNRLDTPSELPK